MREKKLRDMLGKRKKLEKKNKGDVLGTSKTPKPEIKSIMKGGNRKDSKGSSTLIEEVSAQVEEKEKESLDK